VAFQLVRIAVVESTYSQLQQMAFNQGRIAPSVRLMTIEMVLTFFSQASLLAARFILWFGAVKSNGEQ
jgi:hypothetical protein